MKSHMKLETLQIPNDKLVTITKQHFKEFLDFIEYDSIEIPSNVDFSFYNGLDKNNKKGFRGQLNIPNSDNEQFVLTLEQIDCISPCREALYHEFTHLMDYMILNRDIPFDDRLNSLNYITEIRATYIEYLIRCGFHKKSSTINLSKSSVVRSAIKCKSVSLSDEISFYENYLLNEVIARTDRSAEDCAKKLTGLAYYLGFIQIVKRHSDISIDITPVRKAMIEIFGESINLFMILSISLDTKSAQKPK